MASVTLFAPSARLQCFRWGDNNSDTGGKWYESAEEIQRDLDDFIRFYNLKRSHQGYRLKGRTPAQALREAIGRKKLPPIIPTEYKTAEQKAA